MGRLDPNTSITRSLGGYKERSIEHGSDFSSHVVSGENCSLLIIRVSYHISRIHVVEHDLTGFGQNRTVMEVMVEIRYLHQLIHWNVPLLYEYRMSMEKCMAYSLYHRQRSEQ